MSQAGNPKPRVFRLWEDRGVINRYGFNSSGIEVVKKNLEDVCWKKEGVKEGGGGLVVGINLGKNKWTREEDAGGDYRSGVRELGGMGEYVVINVSSPNTPGLRGLQEKEKLRELLVGVLEEREKLEKWVAVLVKVSPDLNKEGCKDIAELVLELGIDGIVVSNTTIGRDGLVSELKNEKGGLSGRPLKELSTRVLKEMYGLTEGKVVLIGVGGIESGDDAYEKIKAGASLVQLYTALVYEGPPLIAKMIRRLEELMERDGYSWITQAVGADHRRKSMTKPD